MSTDTVLGIAAAAAKTDGVDPLDEATRLDLRDGRLSAWGDGHGFALLRGDELSLVVHPDSRRAGIGSRLALALHGAALSAWSRGDHPAASKLAERHGFSRVRELWMMRRPTATPLPELMRESGQLRVRSYLSGDRAELLRVNAAAFANHPEQGAMDEADLARRMSEPWWSPEGLLVAESREGGLAGWHWTKQHDEHTGEVYVVAIAPEAQGRGLGRTLTLAGLHHLTGLGVREIILYVESDNPAAVGLYSGLGFTHDPHDTHVMYRRVGRGAGRP